MLNMKCFYFILHRIVLFILFCFTILTKLIFLVVFCHSLVKENSENSKTNFKKGEKKKIHNIYIIKTVY